MTAKPCNWMCRPAVALLAIFGLLFSPQPASAASELPHRPAYHSITLNADGGVQPDALTHLTESIRSEAAEPEAQLVVLVHGYNTSRTLGRQQYRRIARDLAAAGKRAGWYPVIIGVHWPSHPGALLRWLPQMLGYRFISGTGFPNALTNPYLEKSKLAASTGRTGLRAVLFRLQDNFPHLPLHVFAHSMGSELVIRALSPDLDSGTSPPKRIEQPGRTLRLDMVVLAGADLDQDVFTHTEDDGVPEALNRVAVWWITVPRKNSADAALELRRSAGRRDAVGNVGLVLERKQLSSLLSRRALVIDSRSVPIIHDILAYYTPERLQNLAAALQYLAKGRTKSDASNLLQDADAVLGTPATRLEQLAVEPPNTCSRLYLRWRLQPDRTDFGPVRILP